MFFTWFDLLISLSDIVIIYTPDTCSRNLYKQNVNVLWIRNWQMLLHMHQTDTACALNRWQHFSV